MSKKYRLARNVFVITMTLVGIRLLLTHYTSLTFAPNPLFASVVGGAIFLVAIMVSGTMADYKESEKLPGEIASSLENLYEEAKYARSLNPEFDQERLNARLVRIIDTVKSGLGGSQLQKQALEAVSEVSESLLEMERLKIMTAYIGRMKADRDAVRKNILRMYHIKGTSFVPSGYAILEILSGFVIAAVVFVKLDGLLESILIPALIIFFLSYMLWFIKDMDDPFYGNVAVDLFLLNDIKGKIRETGKSDLQENTLPAGSLSSSSSRGA